MIALQKDLTAAKCICVFLLGAMAVVVSAQPVGTHLNREDHFDGNSFAVDTTSPQLDPYGSGYWNYLPAWDSTTMPFWGYHFYAWNKGSIFTWNDRQWWSYEKSHGRIYGALGAGPVALGVALHQLTGASTLKLFGDESPCDYERDYPAEYHSFVCGMISTERSYAQQYGYFETRAKFSVSPGIQWSICLRNHLATRWADWYGNGPQYKDYDDGMDWGWTDLNSRESASSLIWIADAIGGKTNSVTMGTYHAHVKHPDESSVILDSVTARQEINGVDPQQWHTYGFKWSADSLLWFVDGARKKGRAQTDVDTMHFRSYWNGNYDTTVISDFNEPMFFTIEGHIGNNFSGLPTALTQYPYQMEVDYVKMYDGMEFTSVKTAHAAAVAQPEVRLSGTLISRSRPLVITLTHYFESAQYPPGTVNVAVFNIDGRTVYSATIGAQGIVWNGLTKNKEPLPAGIYLCKVSLANRMVCARITLMP